MRGARGCSSDWEIKAGMRCVGLRAGAGGNSPLLHGARKERCGEMPAMHRLAFCSGQMKGLEAFKE